MREYWKSAGLLQFAGIRTKFVKAEFETALADLGTEKATLFTQAIMTALGGADKKKGKEHKLSTLIFTSHEEIQRVALAVSTCADEKSVGRIVTKTMKGVVPRDAIDVALFGRMFADDHDISVDACCMVAHALSTHKASNELDFFTAMDENKPSVYEDEAHDEGAGAGMMDSAEFISATFYHYAALNLDMLKKQLPSHAPEEIQSIVRAFTEAFAIAIPGARRTSHNAHTRPAFVLATLQTGQPMQLVNAFESPVRANGHGYEQPSIERLMEYRARQNATWGLGYDMEISVPSLTFPAFLDEVSAHV
jgi:CRISPR system Cascade subunit CasC